MPALVDSFVIFALLLSYAGLCRVLDWKAEREPSEATTGGLLLFVVLFASCRVLGASADLTLTLLMSGALLGLLRLGLDLRNQPRLVLAEAGMALVFVVVYALACHLPLNPQAVDTKHYTIDMAWAMQDQWFAANESALTGADARFLFEHMATQRAACPALGFLFNPLGLAIDQGKLQRDQALFVFATLAVLFRFFFRRRRGNAPAGALFALLCAGMALGEFHLQSAIEGGQLNQTLAVFLLAVLCTDLGRYFETGRVPWRSFAVCLALPTSYTEATALLPLAWLLSIACAPHLTRQRVLVSLSLGIGATLVGVLPNIASLYEFFVSQAQAGPGWSPLEKWTGGLWSTTATLVFGRGQAEGVAFVSVCGTLMIWALRSTLKAGDRRDKRVVSLAICSFFALAVFAGLALSHSGNPNYALFKLSGWYGPFLALALHSLTRVSLPSASSRWFRVAALTFVFAVTAVSWRGSLWYLRHMPQRAQQAPVSFVTEDSRSLEVDGFYDATWVRALAPWRERELELR